MNIYTSVAIEAFRKQEYTRRRLNRMEAETEVAVRRVPRDEKDIYYNYTEIIRLELDEKEAKAEKDQETADRCMLQAAKIRESLRDT